MASLNGQTIANSYEQLLHTNNDGGGDGNNLVTINDGDNGTTFGLKLATNKVEVIPSAADDANAFEVSKNDGTAVFTVNTSSPGFSLAGNATITTTDNSDNIALVSTDADANSGPNLNLYRNSGSPADNDFLGNIKFNGRNDNSQDVQYAEIEVYATDVSDDSESGLFNLNLMTGGTNRTYMQLQSDEVVFNEDSADIDFRVESDSNTHMLFVDSGNNRVGIGENNPDENLHIKSDASAATTLKIEATTNGQRADIALYGTYTGSDADFAEILFVNSGDSVGAIQAGRDGANDAGNIKFTTQATGGGMTEKIRITSEGRVIQKNTSLANSCFDIVNGSSSGYGLYIKAGNGSNYSLSVNDYNANNLLSITSGASGTATFAGKIDFSGKPNIGNRVHSANVASGATSSYNMNGAGGNCSGGFIVGACKRDGSITADNSVCIYAHVHTQGANVYSAIIERNDDSDVTISHNGSGQLTCTNNGNSTVNFVVKYIILTGLDGSNNLV